MSISPDQKSASSKSTKSKGCGQAVGLSCSMMMLLFFIGLIIFLKVVQNQGPHPNTHTLLGAYAGSLSSAEDGQKILEAIDDYHASEGVYPDTLLDLVPQTIPDRALLHSDLDPVKDPDHVSWIYIKPAPNAPQSTVVLKLEIALAITVEGEKQYQNSEVQISLDGTMQNIPADKDQKKLLKSLGLG